MKTEITTKIASKTIIYAVVAAIIYYATIVENYSFPLSLKSGVVDVALRQFFEPTIIFLILRFIAELIETLFVGKYIPSLKSTISYLSLLVPVWIFSRLYPILYILTTLTYYTIIVLTGNLFITLTKIYAVEKNNLALGIISNFFSIIFIGYVFSQAGQKIGLKLVSVNFIDISSNLIAGLSNLFLTSSIISAFLTLAVFIEKNENPYVSYFGKKINNKPSENFFRIFVLLSYILYLRPIVDLYLETNRKYLPYFEWGIIMTLSYVFFRNLRQYISINITKTDIMGQWKKHLQIIETRSDYRIDRLTQYIDDFIKKGEKDILLVYLINLLSISHSGLLHTTDAFYDLIYYKPKELELITFQWNLEHTKINEIEKRKEILSSLLPLIEELNIRQDTQDIQSETLIGE